MISYSGDPANVADSLLAGIANCSAGAAGKVRITSAGPHLFSTADVVVVSDVVGTTEANGTWTITVIDATHFDLDGSTFANAYVSGGIADDTSLTPAGTMPSDGEPGTAISIEAFLQLLADRTQFLAQRGTVKSETFLGSGSLVVPDDVRVMDLEGCGAGGGGAGGTPGSSAGTDYGIGGGGGGGAQFVKCSVDVIPGDTLTVTIEAGGAGGAAGTGGNNGGDTIITGTGVNVRFLGAAGATTQGTPKSSAADFAQGGIAVRNQASGSYEFGQTAGAPTGFYASKSPQQGGIGATNQVISLGQCYGMSVGAALTGAPNGGQAGTNGTDDGTRKGGGSGGGGGAGPYGAGGNAGSGGNANNGGNGAVGTAGTAGAANSGAGGGGGGAGGGASGAGGAGGAGAAGGSGRVRISWR